MISKQIVVCGHLVTYYLQQEIDYEKATLLFLHGWRSDSKSWSPVYQKLPQDKYNIVALDLPGFGGSENPQIDFGVKDYAGVVEQFIIKLNVDKVILIGHSFGGRLGIWLAANRPALIDKLVLVDSAGIRTRSKELRIKSYVAKIARPFFKPDFMQGLRKKIYKAIGSEDYLATPELKKTYLKSISEDLTPQLSKINQKTLLIWGKDDNETPLSTGQTMNKEIKNSRLTVIKKAGHNPFLNQTDEFIKELLEFI